MFLFDRGYYWESHEAWEQVWIALGRTGEAADLVKGLIKLAAAGVKYLEGNLRGAQRHFARAVELLPTANAWPTLPFALSPAECTERLERIRRLINATD